MRPEVEETKKLGLLACSCGMCHNVNEFKKLKAEIARLEKLLAEVE